MKTNKNLTFSITHGRTGTTFITKLFELFDDTRSEHEPQPNFARDFPKVKTNPRNAVDFWKEKLEAINEYDESNYVETSNVFGKGYFIPLTRAFDIYPNLLLITREFRNTAQSLYKRGSIPARSKMGILFSCHPTEQAGTLPVFGHEDFTDYQMCYWAVLDAFYRQKQAEQLYVSKELKNYTWLTAYDLHDFQTFKKCGEVCSLIISDEDKAKKAHEQLTQQKFNVNPDRETKEIEDIATQEALVLDRVAYFDVLFTERVLESKYLEDDVKKIFA